MSSIFDKRANIIHVQSFAFSLSFLNRCSLVKRGVWGNFVNHNLNCFPLSSMVFSAVISPSMESKCCTRAELVILPNAFLNPCSYIQWCISMKNKDETPVFEYFFFIAMNMPTTFLPGTISFLLMLLFNYSPSFSIYAKRGKLTLLVLFKYWASSTKVWTMMSWSCRSRYTYMTDAIPY